MDQEALNRKEIDELVARLKEEGLKLGEREQELHDQAEELAAQKEELTAAIEELITKNRSLEQALIQLRERSFELDQILYRTSHDLRGPLSSIRGIMTLLKLEPQSEVVRSYGRHIEDKAIQMDNLLRSLASLSKSILEEPTPGELDVKKLMWQVVGEYRYLPSWDNMDVNIDLHEPKLTTDAALITIIFQSLVSNAFIFRDPLRKGRLLIRTRQEEQQWVAEVIDDGEGIGPEIGDHIFEMFYRGSERSQGSGLGLYVARKAAERLGGTLSFVCEEGTTRFTLRLPNR